MYILQTTCIIYIHIHIYFSILRKCKNIHLNMSMYTENVIEIHNKDLKYESITQHMPNTKIHISKIQLFQTSIFSKNRHSFEPAFCAAGLNI